MIKGKKILITGGGGFIGSWLVEKFYQKNEITCFDNGRRNAFVYLNQDIKKEVRLINGDILDKSKIKKVISNQDIILHLAAIAGASSYDKDPLLTMQVNLFGTANVLENSIQTEPEKVILFSTSETYGPRAENVTEQSPTSAGPAGEGRWSYSVSKLASDHLAMAYFKMYKLPVTIIRPFNIYGPRQVGEGAITNMLTDSLSGKPVRVTGNGTQKRAWCFVSDLVDSVEHMMTQKSNGQIYNIGNPAEYFTVLELAKKIIKFTGAKINFVPAATSEIIERLPNIDKARSELNFNPKISLDQGLKLTKEWFEQNLR